MNNKPKITKLLSSTLITNVIYNYIGFFYVSISGFLIFPFTLHIIGNKANGILLLINSLIGYFSLLDLGIVTTVVKMVAEHTHEKDNKEITKIVVNAICVFVAIGICMVVLALLLTPFLGNFFKIPKELLLQAKFTYVIYIMSVGLIFPAAIFQAVFAGYQNYKLNNIISIIQTTSAIIGSIIVLKLGFGIIGLALISLVSNIVVISLRTYFILAKYHIHFYKFNLFSFKRVKSIFLFSRWILLITVAARLIFQSDVVIIGMFASAAAITAYQIALSPNLFLRAIGDQFNSVTLPASSNLNAQNNEHILQRLLKESTRVTTITMIPFVIVFMIWGRDYITLWVGKSYVTSYYTLITLTIGIFAATIQGTSNQIIIALNKHKVFATIAICEAIVNVLLSIVLLQKFGIIGVALGTTIPALISSLGFSIIYSSKLVHVNPLHIYSRIVHPILVAIPFAFLAYLFNKVIHINNFMELFVYSGVLYVLYFTVALFLEPTERGTYMTLAKKFGSYAYQIFFGVINQTHD